MNVPQHPHSTSLSFEELRRWNPVDMCNHGDALANAILDSTPEQRDPTLAKQLQTIMNFLASGITIAQIPQRAAVIANWKATLELADRQAAIVRTSAETTEHTRNQTRAQFRLHS